MFDKGVITGFEYNFYKILKSSSSNDGVSIEDAIAGDITDSPDSLFHDTCIARFE